MARYTLFAILTLITFVALPHSVRAYDLDTFTGRSVAGGYYVDSWQSLASEGKMLSGYYVPSEDLNIKTLETILCVDATSTNQIRAEIYWLDGGISGTPTLIGYSDWLDDELRVVTGGTNCSATLDLVTFNFGTNQLLRAGREYLITFPTWPNLLDLSSGTGFLKSVYFATSSGLTTLDEIVGINRWLVDDYDNNDTWRPSSFDSIYTSTYLPAIRTSEIPSVVDGPYIAIGSVDISTNDASTTGYACSHNSYSAEYYTQCNIITNSATTTITGIAFDGNYFAVNASSSYIQHWLIGSNSRPIGEPYTLTGLSDTGDFSYVWLFDLPLNNAAQVLNIRSSILDESTGQSATAEISLLFCEQEEDCDARYWEYTQNDGRTFGPPEVVLTDTADNFITTWLDAIKDFGLFAPLIVAYDSTYSDIASSTATSTFVISYDMSAFGLPAPAGTSQFNISAMAHSAEDMLDCDNDNTTCMFEYIDYFLWGIFWLFVFSRILGGAWNVLPDRRNTIVYDKKKFPLGYPLQSHSTKLPYDRSRQHTL